MNVYNAAITGDRLKGLEALRDKLAQSIDECDSLRDLSSLSRQMADVMAQIEELKPAEKKGDSVDEIAQRRAARRSGSAKNKDRTKRTG